MMYLFLREMFVGVAAVALACSALAGNDPLAPALLAGKRVLWLGDSITQDGKYVSFVEYYLNRDFPNRRFDFISVGLASETTSGLSEKAHPFPRPCVFERLQRALDFSKPAIVIACYGMNDGIYHPQSPERMKAFQDGIHRLSHAVKASGAQLLLLTPPPFDPLPVASKTRSQDASDFSYLAPFTNYDQVLNDYAAWEMSLATNDARIVVDFHMALSRYLADQRTKNPRFTLSYDGIHPSPKGHLLMALTFLEALGVKMKVSDLDAELARVNADPLFQLIQKRREQRSAGWLDYIGYTRDRTVKTNSVNHVEEQAAIAQRKIDEIRR